MPNKKVRKIKLIKFNTDRSIEVVNADIKKSIIEYNDEGWEVRNTAFIEYNVDKIYGFWRNKIDALKICFIVRENDPSPLEFKKNKIYGKDISPDDLVYHEDESFSRKVSEVEKTKGKGTTDLIVKSLGITIVVLGVGIVLGVVTVGLPGLPKLIGG